MSEHQSASFGTQFRRDSRGSFAVATGVVFMMIAGASAYAVDYSRAAQYRADLQRAADMAAVATARQLPFILVNEDADGQSKTLTSVAKGMIDARLKDLNVSAKTTASRQDESAVRVDVVISYDAIFGELTGFDDIEISASATAESYGGENICLITTYRGSKRPGIELNQASFLNGQDCGVYSSVPQTDSIKVTGTSRMNSAFICSAGGYEGEKSSFSTDVTTDCPEIEDPLGLRPFPIPALLCDQLDVVLDTGIHAISPGHYCGGLTISGDADVRMAPGNYLFSGGDLVVENEAILTGEKVGLYFQDLISSFRFTDNAEIFISAPVEGELAGVVLATRKWCLTESCEFKRTFVISSSKVRSLLGTVYMPMDQLIVDTTMPVSSEAAFTIVIVGNLLMKQSPTLVLNTDYEATDVPVPEGLAGYKDVRIVH